MSTVKIQGNASGSGAFTIASPNGNTNRTVTLPDASVTVGSGQIQKWIAFDMTSGTTIRESEGISSITDINTGDFKINFTNSFSDGNYAIFIGVNDYSWGGYGTTRTPGDTLAGSCRIYTFYGSANTNNTFDPNWCSIAFVHKQP